MNESTKDKVKALLQTIGYDHRHWTRPVMYDSCKELISRMDVESLEVLEIAPGKHWQTYPFKSFKGVSYPEFDICNDTLDEQFDLIIADQVWEHLLWPYKATKNVLKMLKPGGHFLVTTPFLIKVHAIPHDCTRWTETGIKYFLAECGFPIDMIETNSWGNRKCVKANFRHWSRKGWLGSLKNEKEFPVSVWAIAQK